MLSCFYFLSGEVDDLSGREKREKIREKREEIRDKSTKIKPAFWRGFVKQLFLKMLENDCFQGGAVKKRLQKKDLHPNRNVLECRHFCDIIYL